MLEQIGQSKRPLDEVSVRQLRESALRFAQRVGARKSAPPPPTDRTREVEMADTPERGGGRPAAAPTATIGEDRREYLREAAGVNKARALVAEANVKGPTTSQKETLATLALERIIGSNDMKDINFLELAIATARAVARVKLGNGFGSGALVGPQVFMTNNHVLGTEVVARQSVAQFDYQENISGELMPVQSFRFDPNLFWWTDPVLDFTLVGIEALSQHGTKIESYPWLPLIGKPGKADNGDPVNIIQHPRGGLKQIALRRNEIIEIPAGRSNFLYYTADTDRGSSGSPCFNDQWDLIALHHSGVPKTDAQGHFIKKNGQPFQEGEDDDSDIDWIGNEGARTSAIVAAVQSANLTGIMADLRGMMLESAAPNPIESARGKAVENPFDPNSRKVFPVGGGTTISVPLNITITLGEANSGGTTTTVSTQPQTTSGGSAGGNGFEEVVKIDQNWNNREGYDPDFLGVKVPLPKLSDDQLAITKVVPPEYRFKATDKINFPYHHYSLAMNTKRRFAWYSAAMIDGSKIKDFKREKDKWFIDPRMEDDPENPTLQLGEELYSSTNTDRGHLTRFKDLSWGDTMAEARAGTNDSFHFSNCCLQLDVFNQGKSRWQGLELFLLENTAKKDKRQMVVMTGPVFKTTDPRYQNEKMEKPVRIPINFWKLCALIREDGSLAVTAFVMDQEDVKELPDMLEKFEAEFYQITVAELEKKTRFDFGTLKAHDHLVAGGDPGTLEATKGAKAIRGYEDILI